MVMCNVSRLSCGFLACTLVFALGVVGCQSESGPPEETRSSSSAEPTVPTASPSTPPPVNVTPDDLPSVPSSNSPPSRAATFAAPIRSGYPPRAEVLDVVGQAADLARQMEQGAKLVSISHCRVIDGYMYITGENDCRMVFRYPQPKAAHAQGAEPEESQIQVGIVRSHLVAERVVVSAWRNSAGPLGRLPCSASKAWGAVLASGIDRRLEVFLSLDRTSRPTVGDWSFFTFPFDVRIVNGTTCAFAGKFNVMDDPKKRVPKPAASAAGPKKPWPASTLDIPLNR